MHPSPPDARLRAINVGRILTERRSVPACTAKLRSPVWMNSCFRPYPPNKNKVTVINKRSKQQVRYVLLVLIGALEWKYTRSKEKRVTSAERAQ
jgi:hypothetical protein